MKRFFAILVAALLVVPVMTLADVDLSTFSDEDLLLLETRIKEEKITRGIPASAIITEGKYSIGENGTIPAGKYYVVYESSKQESSPSISDHYYWLSIRLRSSDGRIIESRNMTTELTDHPSIYLEFPEGGTFEVRETGASVRLVKSEGVVFE